MKRDFVEDVKGSRFGRLTAVSFMGKNSYSQKLWLCLCDCGEESIVSQSNLVAGKTNSCGCLQKEGRKRKYIKAE